MLQNKFEYVKDIRANTTDNRKTPYRVILVKENGKESIGGGMCYLEAMINALKVSCHYTFVVDDCLDMVSCLVEQYRNNPVMNHIEDIKNKVVADFEKGSYVYWRRLTQ